MATPHKATPDRATPDKATRGLRLRNLTYGVGDPESVLRKLVCKRLGVHEAQLRGFKLAGQSLDARRRHAGLRFQCQVDVVLDAAVRTQAMKRLEKRGELKETPTPGSFRVDEPHVSTRRAKVVVVGSGPAGMFAALTLSLHECDVLVIDRGAPLQERARRLVAFHRSGVPDPETNLLFGEGGAGTYSDGKLYTRVKDNLETAVLDELIACGAPPAIAYDSRAHIGTDKLHKILPRLRERMVARGVRFSWNTRLDGIDTAAGRVRALKTSAGDIECAAVVLALGHSARDTWEHLARDGVALEAKPFQFGVRIEHPQEMITIGRHGDSEQAALLGAAAYSLVCKAGSGLPAAYSFCMCPGGKIVASVNEPGMLCTNGMSNSSHSSPFANAAIVTTIDVDAFAAYGEGPLAGVAMQRHYEKAFFERGGSDYTAPAQRAPDFIAGRESTGDCRTSYTFGATASRIDDLLPPIARDAIRRALEQFHNMLNGFASEEGILVGLESRSAGPVRMPRDRETYRARGLANLYPVGEGAGFAGGIMSAAIDGARAAQALLRFGVARAGV